MCVYNSNSLNWSNFKIKVAVYSLVHMTVFLSTSQKLTQSGRSGCSISVLAGGSVDLSVNIHRSVFYIVVSAVYDLWYPELCSGLLPLWGTDTNVSSRS